MESQTHKALEAMERAKHPVIVIPKGGGVDSMATALGLSKLLQTMETPHAIVSADGRIPKNLHFLNERAKDVPDVLTDIRTYVIRVDMKQSKADELSYDVVGDQLEIYLTPLKGHWSEKDVSFHTESYRHDLIICIGAPNLEACAHLFEQHTDFFYRTPIVNIDHTTDNEHFGHYNVVDVTAAACGEICHDWISEKMPDVLSKDMATHFLTGMIAKTRSFRTPNVTPKTLQVASALMAKGANRDEIVANLYRTRTVETLRLWGRALARLKSSSEHNLVWTLLSQQDFMHAGAHEADLSGVVEELISSSPKAKVAVILYEDAERKTNAIVHANDPHDALALTTPFKPTGTHKEVRVHLPKENLVKAEKNLIKHLTIMVAS